MGVFAKFIFTTRNEKLRVLAPQLITRLVTLCWIYAHNLLGLGYIYPIMTYGSWTSIHSMGWVGFLGMLGGSNSFALGDPSTTNYPLYFSLSQLFGSSLPLNRDVSWSHLATIINTSLFPNPNIIFLFLSSLSIANSYSSFC